jgi:hypothetical protein
MAARVPPLTRSQQATTLWRWRLQVGKATECDHAITGGRDSTLPVPEKRKILASVLQYGEVMVAPCSHHLTDMKLSA